MARPEPIGRLRIRMIRAESGEVDGIDIGSLRLGVVYDLPASIATYLILNAAGEPVELRAVSPQEERIAVNVQTWREIAASGPSVSESHEDRTSRKKK